MKKVLFILFLIGNTCFGQPTTIDGVYKSAMYGSLNNGIIPSWDNTRKLISSTFEFQADPSECNFLVERSVTQCEILRTVLIFNVSSLPTNITIDSVKLRLYSTYNTGKTVVVTADHWSSCTKYENDWERQTGVAPYEYLSLLTATSNNTYFETWVNALPTNYIFGQQYVGYCLSEYYHDYINSSPAIGGNHFGRFNCNSESNKPQLVIYWHSNQTPTSRKIKIISIL